MNTIRRLTAEYYDRALERHGDSPKGVDWKDSASQRLRFEQLVEALPMDTPFSVLDVGCGTGALVDFLSSHAKNPFRYSGIDLVPRMIDRASEKHNQLAHVTFLRKDLSEITEKYDFVVASGIFNVKQSVSEVDWMSHCTATISEMFERCTKAATFNFLTNRVDFRRDDLFYSDPVFMLEFAQENLTRHVRVNHAYPLYEYTMTLYQDEFIRRNG